MESWTASGQKQVARLVNSHPLQPNPTSGDDGYIICPNDYLFGRSDREPPSNVDMSLIRFSRWKNAARNAEVKDMVLILATEFSKGKFAVCVIDSVKKDQDKKVRKVVVKYKVRAKKHTKHYKYTEKKVRGIALLVTAQERLETETVDMDLKRFDTEDQTCQES